ncbi:hypothetical protein P3T73_12825 [Kiritimatiellota bacterium B12222]|nr:hypothetical protein P3T73_12825 [Kiritimatiellota bacterium B12222]
MEGTTGEKINPSPIERRRELKQAMSSLANAGTHCGSCSGVCCTFLANSMQITPVEAVDLREWLISQNRWNEDLLLSLKTCVKRFRLDQELGDGRRSLRRTYTCPFYLDGPQGCSISRDHKPYGCLAFNPRIPDQTEGGNCCSDQKQLEIRDQNFPTEATQNEHLRQIHHLPYAKAPLPIILLDLEKSSRLDP